MEKFQNEFQHYSPYEVRKSFELEGVNLKKIDQLAYAVNKDNFVVTVAKSGHGKMTRDKDRRDLEGGWIFPKQGKITFYSGTLGEVSDKENVRLAIELALGMNLRIAD
ncbi:MAG: hypothetical protein COU29_01710 [Candidatus Magasanikbacteria bacterium CG10_big_fil_rev_8_21_14_0_10_36_32]|uniref:Uncharacterized protein n=1 Tax=Candidatus Magasanikbacteria bacterium CG10_big_fil_rev_8_21_14_0_10_36_32 TaxID=1974646 RepID=A0A2M6W6R7_9BACT|nr:MAG: hypothetical protein COU29_01710 [Candidatus Magasanikbacteria bacterium CG10_big_fil_rev_8_21_14_0_10_36_32]